MGGFSSTVFHGHDALVFPLEQRFRFYHNQSVELSFSSSSKKVPRRKIPPWLCIRSRRVLKIVLEKRLFIGIMEKTKPEKAYALSYKYTGEYHNCAQGTFAGIQKVMGIDDRCNFIKALSAFDGGVGAGDVCGACCAGVLAFGLLKGKERSYQLTTLLRNKFLDKYGAYNCNKIQQRIFGRSYEFRDPVEKRLFHENKKHKKCYEVAANAAKWAVQLILEDRG